MPGDEKLDYPFQGSQKGFSLLEGSFLKEGMGKEAGNKNRGQRNPMVFHVKLSSMFFAMQEGRTP